MSTEVKQSTSMGESSTDPGEKNLTKMIKRQKARFRTLNLVSESVTLRTFKDDSQVQSRLNYLDKKWDECCALNDEIEDAADDVDRLQYSYLTDDVFHAQELEYPTLRDSILDSLAFLPASAAASPGGRPTASTGLDATRRLVKTPAITIPKFTGKYEEWTSFADYFTSLIINDTNFDNLQRLHYLKSSVEGEALDVIRHVSVTADYFDVAWQLLKQRYCNLRHVFNTSLDRFSSLPSMTRESAQELRKLLSTAQETVNAMRNLKRPVDHWDDILVYFVSHKLNNQTRKAWELSIEGSEKFPKFADLTSFLDARIRALETMKVHAPAVDSKVKGVSKSIARVHVSDSTALSCPVCRERHSIFKCSVLLSTPVNSRFDLVKKHNLCVNCLSAQHNKAHCKSEKRCLQCCKQHHSLLHFEKEKRSNQTPPTVTAKSVPNTSTASSNADASAHFSDSRSNSHILLATAWIMVSGSADRQLRVRALLDQGSTHTLITKELCNSLHLRTEPIDIGLSGIGGRLAERISRFASIRVTSLKNENATLVTNALIMPSLTSYRPQFPANAGCWQHIRGLDLADNFEDTTTPIHVILGADVYAQLLCGGLRHGLPGQPVAQETILGWILSGSTSLHVDVNHITSMSAHSHYAQSIGDIGNALQRFWELEEVSVDRPLSDEDALCEKLFIENCSRDASGRYIVGIPFRSNPPSVLGHSKLQADKIMSSIERKFAKSPDLRVQYQAFMEEYERLGHMVKSPDCDDDEVGAFIPHHPVVRLDSSTTILRVVFNASSPTSNGTSVNDLQLIGPKLQIDLSMLIARWRIFKYALCADIAKMYRQILVKPEDTVYQKIRWRSHPSDSMETYRLLTVTYGTASAPYFALRVLKQLGLDEGANFPLAAPILATSFYVDDCLFGADDFQLAKATRDQLIHLMSLGQMSLRKWASNDPNLLKDLPTEDHGHAFERPLQEDEAIKILGISWSPLTDCYTFNVNTPPLQAVTKRFVLSTIARIFDPLGWIAPVTVTAKIFMQQLWRHALAWDDELPADLAADWDRYYSSLSLCQAIKIPRWIGLGPSIVHSSLIGFADASEKAYAAVAFTRLVSVDGAITVHLIACKTKVAPLKSTSIARLELCAAVLLARLMSSLSSIPEFSGMPKLCWTDSTIVLAWLTQQPDKWPTFVANRVAEVSDRLKNVPWRHVAGNENPADLATRGLTSDILIDKALWWNGPTWLSLPEIDWPITKAEHIACAELQPPATSLVSPVNTDPLEHFYSRFSSWISLLRVTARILRWSPRSPFRVSLVSETIQANEMQDASNRWVEYLQKLLFANERDSLSTSSPLPKSSSLKALNPFLDSSSLIRVGGRLRNADLPESSKFPLVLGNHYVAKLIVRHAHQSCLHGGVTLTLSFLRDEFWLDQAKKVIKSVIFHCVCCARLRGDVARQLMGQLPAARVDRPSRAFTHVGLDYAGPIQVRFASGRGRVSHPAYIAIFVCMAVKAVHLELVSNYTTDAFRAAFDRFCARRGKPSIVYSDNGTNFKGAERELRQAFNDAHSNSHFQALLARDKISWSFIPPAAPHFGGLWEAGVRSVKSHLVRVLKDSTPTFEELSTLLCKVEACLNSRPLSPLTDDPESLTVLTPAHFLVGGSLVTVPQPGLLDEPLNRLSRWQAYQQKFERFWKFWAQDYVRSLQQRTKWKTAEKPIQCGQIVLLRSDNLPPTKWNMGRVVALHPGQDGLVRVVTVKTATSSYVRPITKLALLPVELDAEP